MASAAMIHFGLDGGTFVHFLEREYTDYSRDNHRTLSGVKDHISPEDLAHMNKYSWAVALQNQCSKNHSVIRWRLFQKEILKASMIFQR
jgi:hypothetical protein